MGKGDPKTRRGKIFKGTYGKSRPSPQALRRRKKEAAAAEAAANTAQS
jgi:30S ribosomal protein S31